MTKKQELYEIWRNDNKVSIEEACKAIKLDPRAGYRYKRQFEDGWTPNSPNISNMKRRHGKQGVSREFGDSTGTVEVFSFSIRTLDEALEVANVDMETWEVDRYVINSWEVTMKLSQLDGSDEPETKTNYQVKVWLKRKVPQKREMVIQKLIEQIPTFKFQKAPKFTAPSGIAGEIALVDAHFGKMAWAAETGRRDYDLKIATQDYIAACEQNLAWMEPFKPEKIFYVLGNDYMHTENYQGATPLGGHQLDIDSRLPKIIYTSIATQIRCLYRCRSVAPVEVVWIPGNHDPHASLWLACLLKQHFKSDKYVSVDIGAAKRKARLWGKLLVGWSHDIHTKFVQWSNELAQAFPKLWGESVYREWHTAHKHKKQETKVHPVLTHGGVLIRQLTALSPIDAWHYENLFTDAVPGGESFLWSKKHGVIANFTAWSESPVKT